MSLADVKADRNNIAQTMGRFQDRFALEGVAFSYTIFFLLHFLSFNINLINSRVLVFVPLGVSGYHGEDSVHVG